MSMCVLVMATVLPIIVDIKGAPLNIYGRLVDSDAIIKYHTNVGNHW